MTRIANLGSLPLDSSFPNHVLSLWPVVGSSSLDFVTFTGERHDYDGEDVLDGRE